MNQVYEATDAGLVRSGNEDDAAVFDPSVYVVADGMGGHAAGEIASHLLVKTVRAQLEGVSEIGEEQLRRAVQDANAAILHSEKEHPAYQGMGTTATLLHVSGNMAFWAHVGDSRLYLLRGDRFCQITRDHSYVEDLVEQGEITQAEARIHPRRNLLTRAVGIETELAVDTGSFPLEEGDVLLLATDGLTKLVSDPEIVMLLHSGAADPAAELIRTALAAGGTDNITAIVVVYAS